MTNPGPDAVIEVLQKFGASADRLVDALAAQRKDLKQGQSMRRLLLLAIVLDLCVTVAAAVIITVTVHSSNVVSTINDCTRPTGRCYQQNQANTAKVIGSINDISEAAALCSAEATPGETLPQLDACVKSLLGAK